MYFIKKIFNPLPPDDNEIKQPLLTPGGHGADDDKKRVEIIIELNEFYNAILVSDWFLFSILKWLDIKDFVNFQLVNKQFFEKGINFLKSKLSDPQHKQAEVIIFAKIHSILRQTLQPVYSDEQEREINDFINNELQSLRNHPSQNYELLIKRFIEINLCQYARYPFMKILAISFFVLGVALLTCLLDDNSRFTFLGISGGCFASGAVLWISRKILMSCRSKEITENFENKKVVYNSLLKQMLWHQASDHQDIPESLQVVITTLYSNNP